MDVLADVLQHTRAQGTVFARSSLRPPWGLRFTVEHPVHLHVLTRGRAWLRRGAEATELQENDVLLLTGPTGYDLTDHPSSPTRPFTPDGMGAMPQADARAAGRATLLCGAYDVPDRRSPLLAALPPTVIVRGEHEDGDSLRHVLHLLDSELRTDRPGAAVAADRLVDLLFVVALRTWLAQDPPQHGWWRALSDPVVSAALDALHTDPTASWTLPALARHAKTSRSVLTERFTLLLGVPPITYLAQWRMALARELLRDPGRTVETVAAAVGYSSPFAFSTAFRRHHDCSPRQWRRAHE